jgi:hypothetical protein
MTEPKLPHIAAVDEQGNEVDRSILDKDNVAFVPEEAPLDLTKDEKRRTTALMLAIQAYDKIIIKDAEMFIAVSRDPTHGPTIRPATMNAMVEAAIQFDFFISGGYDRLKNQPAEPLEVEEVKAAEE